MRKWMLLLIVVVIGSLTAVSVFAERPSDEIESNDTPEIVTRKIVSTDIDEIKSYGFNLPKEIEEQIKSGSVKFIVAKPAEGESAYDLIKEYKKQQGITKKEKPKWWEVPAEDEVSEIIRLSIKAEKDVLEELGAVTDKLDAGNLSDDEEEELSLLREKLMSEWLSKKDETVKLMGKYGRLD